VGFGLLITNLEFGDKAIGAIVALQADFCSILEFKMFNSGIDNMKFYGINTLN